MRILPLLCCHDDQVLYLYISFQFFFHSTAMNVPAHQPRRSSLKDDGSGISVSSMVLPPTAPLGCVDSSPPAYSTINPSAIDHPPPYYGGRIMRNSCQTPDGGIYIGLFRLISKI